MINEVTAVAVGLAAAQRLTRPELLRDELADSLVALRQKGHHGAADLTEALSPRRSRVEVLLGTVDRLIQSYSRQ